MSLQVNTNQLFYFKCTFTLLNLNPIFEICSRDMQKGKLQTTEAKWINLRFAKAYIFVVC